MLRRVHCSYFGLRRICFWPVLSAFFEDILTIVTFWFVDLIEIPLFPSLSLEIMFKTKSCSINAYF
jgi:hypothetical protein